MSRIDRNTPTGPTGGADGRKRTDKSAGASAARPAFSNPVNQAGSTGPASGAGAADAHEQVTRMRQVIDEGLRAGRSTDEILDRFVASELESRFGRDFSPGAAESVRAQFDDDGALRAMFDRILARVSHDPERKD